MVDPIAREVGDSGALDVPLPPAGPIVKKVEDSDALDVPLLPAGSVKYSTVQFSLPPESDCFSTDRGEGCAEKYKGYIDDLEVKKNELLQTVSDSKCSEALSDPKMMPGGARIYRTKPHYYFGEQTHKVLVDKQYEDRYPSTNTRDLDPTKGASWFNKSITRTLIVIVMGKLPDAAGNECKFGIVTRVVAAVTFPFRLIFHSVARITQRAANGLVPHMKKPGAQGWLFKGVCGIPFAVCSITSMVFHFVGDIFCAPAAIAWRLRAVWDYPTKQHEKTGQALRDIAKKTADFVNNRREYMEIANRPNSTNRTFCKIQAKLTAEAEKLVKQHQETIELVKATDELPVPKFLPKPEQNVDIDSDDMDDDVSELS